MRDEKQITPLLTLDAQVTTVSIVVTAIQSFSYALDTPKRKAGSLMIALQSGQRITTRVDDAVRAYGMIAQAVAQVSGETIIYCNRFAFQYS